MTEIQTQQADGLQRPADGSVASPGCATARGSAGTGDAAERSQPISRVAPRGGGDRSRLLTVAALFVRGDSIYKTMVGVEAFDAKRDARTSRRGPIVGHPPCRAWSCLKHFAKPAPGEKDLARWCVAQIRARGGVLEHPKGSSLWPDMSLPKPGWLPDEWGGWTLEVDQCCWGHKARKRTWLYIVGTNEIPPVPPWREPTHVVDRPGSARKVERPNSAGKLPWVSKREREATPAAFAEWLVQVARECGRNMLAQSTNCQPSPPSERSERWRNSPVQEAGEQE